MYERGEGPLGSKKPAPDLTRAELQVIGDLSREQVLEVVRANRGQLDSCYQSIPNLEGGLMLKVVIAKSGAVRATEVTYTTLGNSAVESCVAERVKTWQFPTHTGDGVVIVEYPLVLTKAGAKVLDAGPSTAH